jgi:hypothetical protein
VEGAGDQPRHGGFLPPEPPGPEPELEPPPQQTETWAPPAGATQEPPAPGWQPPAAQQPGWAGAPPGAQQAAPGTQQPGWAGAPPGQAPPPPGWQPPPPPGQAPPPGYAQTWQAREPDNGPAVTGFVLSMIGAGLLLFLLAPISLVCAIFGIVYSRRGKQKVASGETSRNKGLAQAGFVSGIVVTALSVLVTLIEILIVVLYATDDQFRDDLQDDLERELDESQTVTAAIRLAAPAVRAVAGLVT